MLFILCVSILRNEMKRGTVKQLQNSKIVKRGKMDTTEILLKVALITIASHCVMMLMITFSVFVFKFRGRNET